MGQSQFYQIFPKLSSKRALVISVLSVISFLTLWWVVSFFEVLPPMILPGPQSVLDKFLDVLANGYADKSLSTHFGISLYRILLSLLIATALAVPIGIFVAINDYFKSIIDPFIEFYRPLPPLAYLPLVIVWFGIGETSKVILITLAIFSPIFMNTRAGVLSIPKERILAALSLGANRFQLIYSIVLPSSLYHILTGIRIGIGFGWTTLVAAEMVAANSGLGHMVLTASEFLVTEVVIIGIFIIGLIAIGTDLIMRKLIEKFIHWHGK